MSVLFLSLFSRWSDKTEIDFQNWADSGLNSDLKKSWTCLSMSSTGKHGHMKHAHSYLMAVASGEISLGCYREVVGKEMQRTSRLRVQEKDGICGGDSPGATLHWSMSREVALLRTQGTN